MDDQPTTDGINQARRRLGRGLNSLIGGGPSMSISEQPPTAPPDEPGEFLLLGIDDLERNPYQPRRDFEAEALAELVESVTQHGVLQPLLVRKTSQGYQLIAGERRWIAARRAGLSTVPCRIIELEDRAVSEVAIIENVQRSDLGELEKAMAFQDYLSRFGGTIEELATKMGKNRSTISNALRLLELPEFVKVALQSGKISAGHARALLPLDEEADQIAMCQQIQSESLNVRQVEELVRNKTQDDSTVPFPPSGSNGDSKPGKPGLSNHILSLQQQLRDLLGTKVELKMKGKDAGKVIVHFSSHDEFERILQFLRKAA